MVFAVNIYMCNSCFLQVMNSDCLCGVFKLFLEIMFCKFPNRVKNNLVEIRIPKKFSWRTDRKFLRNPNLNEIKLRMKSINEWFFVPYLIVVTDYRVPCNLPIWFLKIFRNVFWTHQIKLLQVFLGVSQELHVFIIILNYWFLWDSYFWHTNKKCISSSISPDVQVYILLSQRILEKNQLTSIF